MDCSTVETQLSNSGVFGAQVSQMPCCVQFGAKRPPPWLCCSSWGSGAEADARMWPGDGCARSCHCRCRRTRCCHPCPPTLLQGLFGFQQNRPSWWRTINVYNFHSAKGWHLYQHEACFYLIERGFEGYLKINCIVKAPCCPSARYVTEVTWLMLCQV